MIRMKLTKTFIVLLTFNVITFSLILQKPALWAWEIDKESTSFLEKPKIASELTVANPNITSSWYEGNTYTIQWTSDGEISSVDLSLYKCTDLVETIVVATENDGEYEWAIPTTENYKGINFRIRITDHSDSTVEAYSDFFKINYASITISKPAANSIINAGEVYTITWDSVGYVNDVSIELYKDSRFIEYISSSTENDGLYEWSVGFYETGADYSIQIRDKEDSAVFDSSQAFKIDNPHMPIIIIGSVIGTTIIIILSIGTISYIYLNKQRSKKNREMPS